MSDNWKKWNATQILNYGSSRLSKGRSFWFWQKGYKRHHLIHFLTRVANAPSNPELWIIQALKREILLILTKRLQKTSSNSLFDESCEYTFKSWIMDHPSSQKGDPSDSDKKGYKRHHLINYWNATEMRLNCDWQRNRCNHKGCFSASSGEWRYQSKQR